MVSITVIILQVLLGTKCVGVRAAGSAAGSPIPVGQHHPQFTDDETEVQRFRAMELSLPAAEPHPLWAFPLSHVLGGPWGLSSGHILEHAEFCLKSCVCGDTYCTLSVTCITPLLEHHSREGQESRVGRLSPTQPGALGVETVESQT